MLQTLYTYIWIFLIPFGLLLLILRPIAMLRNKKKPLAPRTKSILWFLQALGFWALLIGGWMRFSGIIIDLFEDEPDPVTSSAFAPDERAREKS